MATNVGGIGHRENLAVGNHDFGPENQAIFAFAPFEFKQRENSLPGEGFVPTLQGKAHGQHHTVLSQKPHGPLWFRQHSI